MGGSDWLPAINAKFLTSKVQSKKVKDRGSIDRYSAQQSSEQNSQDNGEEKKSQDEYCSAAQIQTGQQRAPGGKDGPGCVLTCRGEINTSSAKFGMNY